MYRDRSTKAHCHNVYYLSLMLSVRFSTIIAVTQLYVGTNKQLIGSEIMLLRITNLPPESSFRLLPGLTQSNSIVVTGGVRHIGALLFLFTNIPNSNEIGRDLFENHRFSVKKSEKSGI